MGYLTLFYDLIQYFLIYIAQNRGFIKTFSLKSEIENPIKGVMPPLGFLQSTKTFNAQLEG